MKCVPPHQTIIAENYSDLCDGRNVGPWTPAVPQEVFPAAAKANPVVEKPRSRVFQECRFHIGLSQSRSKTEQLKLLGEQVGTMENSFG